MELTKYGRWIKIEGGLKIEKVKYKKGSKN